MVLIDNNVKNKPVVGDIVFFRCLQALNNKYINGVVPCLFKRGFQCSGREGSKAEKLWRETIEH